MAVTIQNQNFGVEIELTGITRETAAKTIADYYGTRSLYAGGSYHTYTAADNKGKRSRCQFIMRDPCTY